MAEYNLSEFRANTKRAFDEAERGEVVVIDRYGTDFYLVAKGNWSPPDTANKLENKYHPPRQNKYDALLAPTMKIGVTLHNLRKETIV